MRPEKQNDDSESAAAIQQSKPSLAPGLRIIAGFKIIQGLILALVGTGFLLFISRDADAQVAQWLAALQINTDSDFIRRLLSKLDVTSPLKFKHLSIGAFLYAGLLLTEGSGLLMQKRWAEFLTVFVTGSFLPLELYEIVKHFTPTALAIFVVNLMIVWYLVNALNKQLKKGDPSR